MSIDSAIKYIKTMDLSMIENKMIQSYGWRANEAKQAKILYKNYLFLRLKYPTESLPPSKDIDEFWHNHILDTKKYREDCQAIFGHFFDHYPYFGMDEYSTKQDLEFAFEKIQRLHMKEFGYRIPRVRYPKIMGWVVRLVELIGLSQSKKTIKNISSREVINL